MDGLTLLQEAKQAGLTVSADGGRIRIRGPKRAADLAHLLIEHKESILALLNGGASTANEPITIPPEPPPRPGWINALSIRNNEIVWVQRRRDEADDAYDAYLKNPDIAFVLTSEPAHDAKIPAGWIRSRWIARLRTLANACEQIRPDMAAIHRAEADRLEHTAPRSVEGG